MRMRAGNRRSASRIISFELAATGLTPCPDGLDETAQIAAGDLDVRVVGKLAVADFPLGDARDARAMEMVCLDAALGRSRAVNQPLEDKARHRTTP
jgi:hypothetical protein